MCLETRSILADYNAAEHSLTVYHSTQAPHMMQDIFSRHLGIPEANVRVIAKDVGGSFGIKVHVYPDEMATAALSVMLRRPVKFVADRLESFAHRHPRARAQGESAARVHEGRRNPRLRPRRPDRASARTRSIRAPAASRATRWSTSPAARTSTRSTAAKLNVVFTNKNVTCQYRAVGHPIAVALTEGIVDLAAAKLGMDPAEFRRKNLIPDDAYPYTFPSGMKFEKLSHHQTLDKLLAADGVQEAAARAGGNCERRASIAASAWRR